MAPKLRGWLPPLTHGVGMKLSTFIACVGLVVTAGCTDARQAVCGRRMTEAQVLALAKPRLPLPTGESYHVHFREGTWEVSTERESVPVRCWRVILIRDLDGKVEEAIRF